MDDYHNKRYVHEFTEIRRRRLLNIEETIIMKQPPCQPIQRDILNKKNRLNA